MTTQELLTIGKLVTRLAEVGELTISPGYDTETVGQGYYVKLADEWGDVALWRKSLADALREVDRQYSLVANYG
jgi:hypothetical protein